MLGLFYEYSIDLFWVRVMRQNAAIINPRCDRQRTKGQADSMHTHAVLCKRHVQPRAGAMTHRTVKDYSVSTFRMAWA